MGRDLCLPVDGGILNIRVGAIITKNGKILMAGNQTVKHLYSVGGRIKFGESAEEAVVREVFEETGIQMEIDRLGFIHENFFPGDDDAKQGNIVHEIAYFFYMKVPEDFEPVGMVFDEEREQNFLEWVSPDDERTIYPEFFRTELAEPEDYIKYFVTRDI